MARARTTTGRRNRSSGNVAAEVTKWLALLITSGAALVSFLSDSSSIGLFGWVASEGLSLSDYVVRSIRLSPTVDTATAIGDTVYFAATVTDKRGSTVIGATVAWSSLDPEVVTVDSSGSAVARGPGAARVVASVREYADTSRVLVRQDLAGVRIDFEDLTPIPEAGTRQLYARAVDSRRHEILGIPVRWETSDSATLVVDSLGMATGVVPGEVVVRAHAGNQSGSARVRVVPAAGRVAVVQGEGQHTAVREATPEPVRVRVWSRGGTPLVGATVRFIPLEGSGVAVTPDAVTDDRGVAQSEWVMGARPGVQHLKIAVDGADSALVITAEAEPSAANLRVVLIGDTLRGRYGAKLSSEVVIQASDSLGRVVPGLRVSWSTTDGGSLRPDSARTDSLGRASATWQLGPRAGRQIAMAQVADPRFVPPLEIVAIAQAGAVSRIEEAGGGGQRGKVAAPLARPIAVRAIDQAGNPVSGAVVLAQPLDGSVEQANAVTDDGGRATFRWTLGSAAGGQRLLLRVDGLAAVLEVKATATALGPANIEFVDPPNSGTVNRPLPDKVIARVTDAYGNPVADRQVFFSGPAGVVNPQRRMTDSAGMAGTIWTLGATPGTSWLQAAVSKTKLTARMTVTVGSR